MRGLDIRHPNTRLVFCGGTSLSKAYELIERMSEEVDLKVVLDEPKVGGGLPQSKALFVS